MTATAEASDDEALRPDWALLSEEQFNELMRLARMYRREADRSKNAKAYLAACVMIGSALEAALICMVHLYWRDIPRDALLPSKKNRIRSVLDWVLGDLVRVAALAGWLPRRGDGAAHWESRGVKIGDYAAWIHRLRNLVHPARYLLDHPKQRVTERYARTAFEVLSLASDHFVARVAKSFKEQGV